MAGSPLKRHSDHLETGSESLTHGQLALTELPISESDGNFRHSRSLLSHSKQYLFQYRISIDSEGLKFDFLQGTHAITSHGTTAVADGQTKTTDGKTVDQSTHPLSMNGPTHYFSSSGIS